MSSSPASNFKQLFADWQQQKNVETEFHPEYTFTQPISDVAPLNALFRSHEKKGIELFREWQNEFMSFVTPIEMKIVSAAEDGDLGYITMNQKAIFFNSVEHEFNIVMHVTYKDGKVFHLQSFVDIKPLEAKFLALEAQRKANVASFHVMKEKFQNQDVEGLLAMMHPDIQFVLPQTTVAPYNELYREYPKGHGGFLQWMAAFGKFFTDVESLGPIEVVALDNKTTLSDWRLKGNRFGVWDDEEFSSMWKHTWEEGKLLRVQCLDNIGEFMSQQSPVQNLAAFNAGFRAWATGNVEGLLAMTHDDYTYDCPTSNVAPLSTVFKKYTSTGPQCMKDFVEAQHGTVEFKAIKPTQVRAVKDCVYVTWVTQEVWGDVALPEMQNQWVFTFKGGKFYHCRDMTDLSAYERCF